MIHPIQSRWKITLYPPCKINLHLLVGKRRDDGFHGLKSIFAALDFSDTLTLMVLPGNEAQTTLSMQEEEPIRELSGKGRVFPPIPVENNLVYRAVELFRLKTGLSVNLAIDLIKRIPPGSGMGGSSSNAAATLLALNELVRFLQESREQPAGSDWSDKGSPLETAGLSAGPLSREVLLSLALQLGCDVPFFVEVALQKPLTSAVRAVGGRGEILRPLPPFPPLGVLLAFPGFSSYTGAAYSLLDERRPFVKEEQVRNCNDTTDNPPAGMNGSWPPPENWDFTNDFQELFLNHGTEQEKTAYRTILQDLKEAGAAFAALSGSGSTCFGIFSGPKEAEQAQKKLSGTFYALQSSFFLRYE